MMTVHDHIEGSFGAGANQRSGELKVGELGIGGARGKIRAGCVLFRLGLRCAALSLD